MQTKVQTQYQFKLSEAEYATLARLAARGLRAEHPDGDVDEDDLVTVLTFVQHTGMDVWDEDGEEALDPDSEAEDAARPQSAAEAAGENPDLVKSAEKSRFGIRRRHSA